MSDEDSRPEPPHVLPLAAGGADSRQPSALDEEEIDEGQSEPSAFGEAFLENNAAVRDWKEALREKFETWLESLDHIPPLDSAEIPEGEAPDLYSFHAELAALSTETRKANRQTAEAFSQWGETLGHFDADLKQLREQLTQAPVQAKEDAIPRAYCMALAEIADRLQRLLEGFGKTPPKSWWGADHRWIESWKNQAHAFRILQSHFDALLEKAGLRRLEVNGQIFDPTRMVAIATETNPSKPHQLVLEQLAPGYLRGDEVLRPAQVKVNLNKPS